MRRAGGALGALIALTTPARADTVRTVWNETLHGRIVEGVRGDYVLLRREDGSERVVQWSSIREINAVSPERFDVPWPLRPSLGVRAGVSSVSADWFSPYLSAGAMLGVTAGVSLSRAVAAAALYETTSHPPDERNPSAPAGRSHFLAVALRIRTSSALGTTGLFLEPAIGLRSTSYAFSPNDGNDEFFEPPRGPMSERASLFGGEVRFAIGAAFSPSRTLSIDFFVAPGIGYYVRYRDTLDCSTFRFNNCGSSTRFSFLTTTFAAAIHWN